MFEKLSYYTYYKYYKYVYSDFTDFTYILVRKSFKKYCFETLLYFSQTLLAQLFLAEVLS